MEPPPPLIAWTIIAIGYLLPLAHVVLSKDGGPWVGPKTDTCPFSPRVGWLVIVLFLGIFGWLLFMRVKWRKNTPRNDKGNGP